MLPISFAPLQGYTEDGYRRIHNEECSGVTEYYSPFLRLEHGEVRSKDMRDIRPAFNEGTPLVPQAIANGGEELQVLTEVVRQNGYKRLDINMGCPFPLQTRHGRGAGLLSNIDKIKEICQVIKDNSDIAYSVKMRLGMTSPDEWREVLPLLNDTPLVHITVHPRIATQQYKGAINMEQFSEFLNMDEHPVIYNGDITTVEQIRQIETTFPTLHGIMIGRGLLARPSLAREYAEDRSLSDAEVRHLLVTMHDRLHAHYANIIPNESQLHSKLRSFWEYTEPTIGRKAWKQIMKAGNMKNYLAAITR